MKLTLSLRNFLGPPWMLPRVILMHGLDSSHSESHSGGLVKPPSKEFVREIFKKSWFYELFFFSLWGPLQGPPSGPPPPAQGPADQAAPWPRSPGVGWLDFGWLVAGCSFYGWILVGFRADFGWILI